MNEEKVKINDLLEELGFVNWEKAMAEAVAPATQDEERNNGVIGIGTDGKPVDMDLWEYTLMANGTYGLNDEQSLAASGTRSDGYLGEINSGKIEGLMPQYIKSPNDSNFIEVTNIAFVFYNNQKIIEAPNIPTTVVNMYNTFNGCILLNTVNQLPDKVSNMQGAFNGCVELENISNLPLYSENISYIFSNCRKLKSIPNIPDGVTNMLGSFSNCSSLENIPNLPDSVTNMEYSFLSCTSLENIPNIPRGVTNMNATFAGCTLLGEIDITIPESVTTMRNLFQACNNLYGNITILANISLEQEVDGKYAYTGWLDYAASKTTELLIIGPKEKQSLIEQIKPINITNIKGIWEI